MDSHSDAPTLGDVVRRRLDHLLHEISPRRLDLPTATFDAPADDRRPSASGRAQLTAVRDDDPAADHAYWSGASVDEELSPPTERGAEGEGQPEPPPPARVRLRRFGRPHLIAVVGVGLLACLVAWWSLTQTRTVQVADSVPTVSRPSSAASGSSAAAGGASGGGAVASPTPMLVVHVLGAVRKPGVHRLPAGSRVGDAIAAAGGVTPNARPGDMNLAAVLADGVQVKVGDGRMPSLVGGGGVGGAGPGAGAGGPAAAKVNLNTATDADLDALPGVGPVTAKAILGWRTEHGRFTRVDELQEVDGIGPKTYAQLANLVTV